MAGTWMTVKVYAAGAPSIMYAPGHDVVINEIADSMARLCKTPVLLQLYYANIKVLVSNLIPTQFSVPQIEYPPGGSSKNVVMYTSCCRFSG